MLLFPALLKLWAERKLPRQSDKSTQADEAFKAFIVAKVMK